jgi:glyoxylase-like metal-dependent hydrolase (beta-lactamase superfamily II)
MEKTFSVEQICSGACFSYVLVSGSQALLIDPHITKPAIYRDLIHKRGLTVAGIVDTHTHADHISSAAILKSEFNCPLYMSKKAISSFNPQRVGTGDTIPFGTAKLEVLESQGHTDDSISLLAQGVVFTGDVLMIGSVGRTDFQNGSPEEMFETLKRFKAMDAETTVYPAHDYKNHTESTIGAEIAQNPFMAQTDKAAFVQTMRSKTLPKPFNMDAIIDINRRGTAAEIEAVDAAEVKHRLDSGQWKLLDVRRVDEYQAVRIEPSLNIPIDTLAGQAERLKGASQWIVSCRSGARAAQAAELLLSLGMQNICIAKESLNGWLKNGYPVVKENVPISLERQVRMIAGSFALIGGLLGLLVSRWFLIIPIFVGSGLLFAGLTDSCMMGLLLMKLPYNRKATAKAAAMPGGSCAMDGGGCSVSNGGCSMG